MSSSSNSRQAEGISTDTGNPAEQEIAKIIEHRKVDASSKTESNIAMLCMYYSQFTIEDVLNMPLGNFRAYMRAIEERKLEEVGNALLTAGCVMNPKGIKSASRKLEQARARLRSQL